MADENHKTSLLSLLPEGCIANIISLTSPRDACKAAVVSRGFKSAAESDTVWERFLPPDYQEILSRSCSPVASSSKKELYFMLCDSGILLDGGKLSFGLSRSTGRKCYLLCARELQIIWGGTPEYWSWISFPESRFGEVAELLDVCWLDIQGVLQAQMLSPNTNYAAYLVYKISKNHHGLDSPANASVKIVAENTEASTVYLVPPNVRGRRRRGLVSGRNMDGRLPSSRIDGWQEIELGEFFIAEGEISDVQIQLRETENRHWKKGLIVEGIMVRPKEAF